MNVISDFLPMYSKFSDKLLYKIHLIDYRYNIDGSTGEDCMCAWCCGPCVGCQMANELDDRGA